jgi:hypothetical protein
VTGVVVVVSLSSESVSQCRGQCHSPVSWSVSCLVSVESVSVESVESVQSQCHSSCRVVCRQCRVSRVSRVRVSQSSTISERPTDTGTPTSTPAVDQPIEDALVQICRRVLSSAAPSTPTDLPWPT